MSAVCFNCFRDIPDDSSCCPFCGFDGKRNRDRYPQALPFDTILSGHYITGRVLGQGGFGITYVAMDYKSKKLVAIKEFFPGALAQRTSAISVSPYAGERGENFSYGKEMFLQEAKTMAEFIGTPNVVRVYSYFEENGTAYFVMDYIVGKSFQQMIEESGGKLSWDEAVGVIIPVLKALNDVHSKGIIHRDATPDNIYITENGTVKLLDFGAARYSLGDASCSLDVVLKHGFAPKEQYSRSGKQGPYTDIYCVAASLYYALTGHKPPDAIDRMENDELIPPSSVGAKVTREQENVLLKALAVSPADRYQSAKEFMDGLEAASPVADPAFDAAVEKVDRISESMSAEEQIGEYQKARDAFARYPNNVKAKNYIHICEEKIKELGQALDRQKRKKRLTMLGIIVAVVLVIFGLVLFALTRPKTIKSSGNALSSTETQSTQAEVKEVQKSNPELSVTVSPDDRALEITMVCSEDYTEVRFPVWNQNTDQNDIKWYSAKKDTGKTWTCSVPLADYGNLGVYYVHAYGIKNDVETKVAAASVEVKRIVTPRLTAKVAEDKRTLNIRLTDGGFYSKVLFPTWSDVNGQDDLTQPWPAGQKQNDGSWVCSLDLAEHGDLGDYTIHAYGYADDWSEKIAETKVNVEMINVPMVTAKVSSDNTALEIVVTGAEAESGVRLWVWSAVNDQDDKRDYTAQQNSDGSWSCSVGLNNHGDTGTYYVHAYVVRDGNEEYFAQTSVDVRTIACPAIQTTVSADRGTMKIILSGVVTKEKLTLAIWRQGSEDQLKWLTPDLQIDGSYACLITLSDFGGIGTYHIDAYMGSESKQMIASRISAVS